MLKLLKYLLIFVLVCIILISLIYGVSRLIQDNSNKLNKNQSSDKTEGYRIRARAYGTCPPNDCYLREIKNNDLEVYNPYRWPHSGTANPKDILYKYNAKRRGENKEKSEELPMEELPMEESTAEEFITKMKNKNTIKSNLERFDQMGSIPDHDVLTT